MHPSLTVNRLVSAVKRSMFDESFPGFCTTCGRKAKHPCEPDLRGATCQFKSCGQATVYGAEELLFMVQA